MYKLRKKIGLAVLCASFLALAPSFVNAAGYGGNCGSCNTCDTCNTCNDCYDPCDCGGFEFYADFIWWKPCVDDLDYAAVKESSSRDNFKHRCICPEWEPGFRVGFAMPDFYCDWGLSASWTYIESDDSGSVKKDDLVYGSLLHANVQPGHMFDQASASWDTTYHEWDLLFSTDLSCKECHHFMPFFGLAGIFLDQKFSADYYDKDNAGKYVKTATAAWDSDIWGIGLRAGTEYQYRFSDCLSFFSKAWGSILYSEGDGELDSKDRSGVPEGSGQIKAKDDDCCQLMPGWHIGAGFIYDSSWCDCDFQFRLGYEFLQWCNVPNHRVYDRDSVTHSTSPSTRTFGFHGLMAGLGMSF